MNLLGQIWIIGCGHLWISNLMRQPGWDVSRLPRFAKKNQWKSTFYAASHLLKGKLAFCINFFHLDPVDLDTSLFRAVHFPVTFFWPQLLFAGKKCSTKEREARQYPVVLLDPEDHIRQRYKTTKEWRLPVGKGQNDGWKWRFNKNHTQRNDDEMCVCDRFVGRETLQRFGCSSISLLLLAAP